MKDEKLDRLIAYFPGCIIEARRYGDFILPNALVAQGIERRPPEPGAQVRFLSRAPKLRQGVRAGTMYRPVFLLRP